MAPHSPPKDPVPEGWWDLFEKAVPRVQVALVEGLQVVPLVLRVPPPVQQAQPRAGGVAQLAAEVVGAIEGGGGVHVAVVVVVQMGHGHAATGW